MAKHTPAWIARFLAIDIESARLVREILDNRIDLLSIKPVYSWYSRLHNEPARYELKMEAFNAVIGGHGVEAFSEEGHYNEPVIVYVNTGDTYSPTIAYINGRYRFTTWGDEVERIEEERRQRQEVIDWGM